MPCLFLKLISVCLHRFSADTVGACHLPEQSALLHQVSATSWSVCALWECVNLFHHRLEGWIKVGLFIVVTNGYEDCMSVFDLFFCYQTLLKQAVHSIFQPSVIGCFYSWPFPLVYINVEGGGNSEWRVQMLSKTDGTTKRTKLKWGDVCPMSMYQFLWQNITTNDDVVVEVESVCQ